jgi:hypothetical protein
MRNSPNTLEILQDLGFIYHIDDPSADEPFFHKWANGVWDFGAGPGSEVSPKNFRKDA